MVLYMSVLLSSNGGREYGGTLRSRDGDACTLRLVLFDETAPSRWVFVLVPFEEWVPSRTGGAAIIPMSQHVSGW